MNETSIGPRLPLEWRVPLLAFLAGGPALGVALYLVWTGSHPALLRWAISGVCLGALVGGGLYLRRHVVRPLQTLSNMIAAFRAGDYSMRVRVGEPEDDALGLLTTEMNLLGAMLREQRLEVLEATALLRRVMEEIDVAVMAFDGDDRLVLANRAAEELLGRSEAALRGRTAESLDLADLLAERSPRTLEHEFPGGRGPWEVKMRTFRQQGRSHRLVVLADLGRALREEERRAWQRLVRVLSHEINNSLAPIRSISDSLLSLLQRREAGDDGGGASAPDDEAMDDLRQGLEVIGGRAEAVARFMSSYARLARLPEPELEPVRVSDWVARVARLETRLDVEVEEGPDVRVRADGDQLDQLLINLVDNAVDAALETGGGVRVGWSANGRHVEVRVEDEGPGIAGSDNLFVPFFTTKEDGSGIGLALCRQIAGAHDGSVSLENRPDGDGCLARVRLPRY